ncbi:MarR family transcriptional regulator [Humibacter ginsenosidimutans]|uniref:MarR family transcriptional regulator n=2 Tax=Humibacter ginsenosidimutans TaxID=2599293 RepID=A0A5B8M722_9MICO|nr:MarR family transcriptional regulator [Humibacter ginsenosidimutans]
MIPTMTETDHVADASVPSGTGDLDDAIVSVEREFGALFVQLRNRMRLQAQELHPQVQPFGYLMLSALLRSGPMHAGALAEALSADKSLVSRQASQLEQLGLLRREQDPADRRATYFTITDEARGRLDRIIGNNRRELRAGLTGWNVEDVRVFARLLHRMNEF